jgi:transposase InsO family protein
MNRITLNYDVLNQVKEFLKNGEPPKRMPRSSYYKFMTRYNDGTWTLKNDKVYHNGKECVPEEDTTELLERLWNDPFYSHASPRKFHSRIVQEYEGVSVNTIAKFLETKRTAQIFKRPPRTEVTALNTRFPKSQYQIDFIDLKKSQHANLNNRYCLTVICHFSKYAWAFPLKTRDSDIAAGKMKELFQQGHVPRVLHVDGEFANIELGKVCKEFGVKFIKSEPYRPNANGCIERFNRTLKTAIRQLQVEFDDLTFVDALDKILGNYNNTIHTSHKMTPRQVYYGNQEIIDQAYETLTKYRKHRIWRGSTQDTNLEPGTKVRIAIRADPKERKKRTFKKRGYDVQFSNEIYTISKHYVPHTPLGNHYYTVEGRTKKYSRSELEVIPNTTDNSPAERPKFDVEFRGRTPKTRVMRRERTTYRAPEPIPVVRPKSTRVRRFNSQLEDYV